MFSSIFLSHYVFLKDVSQPLKLIEVKKEGEERKKTCRLIDLVSTQERLAWNIIWAFSAAFTIPKQYKGPYFWSSTWTDRWTDAYTQESFSCLANIRNHISESDPIPSSVPVLFLCFILQSLKRSLICQPTMFDYNTNGCLRASPLSVSGFPAAEIEI